MHRPLHIGIDARLFSGKSGGIEQVAIGLVHALSELTDGDEIAIEFSGFERRLQALLRVEDARAAIRQVLQMAGFQGRQFPRGKQGDGAIEEAVRTLMQQAVAGQRPIRPLGKLGYALRNAYGADVNTASFQRVADRMKAIRAANPQQQQVPQMPQGAVGPNGVPQPGTPPPSPNPGGQAQPQAAQPAPTPAPAP